MTTSEDGTLTRAIDVGGSGLEAAVLDPTGAIVGDRARAQRQHNDQEESP